MKRLVLIVVGIAAIVGAGMAANASQAASPVVRHVVTKTAIAKPAPKVVAPVVSAPPTTTPTTTPPVTTPPVVHQSAPVAAPAVRPVAPVATTTTPTTAVPVAPGDTTGDGPQPVGTSQVVSSPSYVVTWTYAYDNPDAILDPVQPGTYAGNLADATLVQQQEQALIGVEGNSQSPAGMHVASVSAVTLVPGTATTGG